MRTQGILHFGYALLALAVLSTGCGKACDYCDPYSLTNRCQDGFQCLSNMCVRAGGNLPGECCDQGSSKCADEYYCVYQTCEASPVYPPPKEQVDDSPQQFAIDGNTKIIIPLSPSATEQTAGEILQAQIQESYGLTVTPRNYSDDEDPPANSIVLGTIASNPAVQTLVNQLGVAIPDDGPLPNENYTLKITPDNILVAGRGETGVIFGSQALKQIIRGESEKDTSGTLGALTINDYPDTEQRMFIILFTHYYVPDDNDEDGEKDPYKLHNVPFQIDTVRDYLHILSEFRYNIAILKLGDMVAWDSIPEPQSNAISPTEFMALAEEANDYGLEVIPLINGASSHYGWIGTSENPVEFTEEYSLAHNDEHLAIYLELIQEIFDAFQPIQPLRYFHTAMDEDWSFGPRTKTTHAAWVNQAYDLIATGNNSKMMLWHDDWTMTTDYLYNSVNYPNMHVMVWDYNTYLPLTTMEEMKAVAQKGMEVSWGLYGNGRSSEFTTWFANNNPLMKGFAGIKWTKSGSACQEPSSAIYSSTINTYMRKHARQFWNGAHY